MIAFDVSLRLHLFTPWHGFSFQYQMAKEQARLHEKFDEHMASGALDRYICEVSYSIVGRMQYVYMFCKYIASLTCHLRFTG
jgi:hypothetical protein